MFINKLILIIAALMVFACTVAAQDQTQEQPAKVIKHVPVQSTSPVSGKDMYTAIIKISLFMNIAFSPFDSGHSCLKR